MKRNIILFLVIVVNSCLLLVVLNGCGSRVDPEQKYVVFENVYSNDGVEKYRLDYPGVYSIEYEYDESRKYYFRYTAYYADNDEITGETGWYILGAIPGNKPGNYHVVANINLGESGYRQYELKITIKEKPDLRVMPEIKFDPNGADVKEYDGETVYIYGYDSWIRYYKENYNYPFPILELYDGDKKIEIPTSDSYMYKSVDIDSGKQEAFPTAVGTYRLYYYFYDYSDSDKEKYFSVNVNILVQIQE